MASTEPTPAVWLVIESPAGELSAHRPGSVILHSRIASGWQVARIARGDRAVILKEVQAVVWCRQTDLNGEARP